MLIHLLIFYMRLCQVDFLLLFIFWSSNDMQQLKYYTGLTKPSKVGDFFTLVSLKSPYSCHKWSFSCTVSLGSQYMYFFTKNHNFSSIFTYKELPCSWNKTCTGFDIQYFVTTLLMAYLFKSLYSTFVLGF